MNLSRHPESTEEARKAPIGVLDLSATFLERIHEDWIKDLPQLTSFYLTQMPKLRRLDPAVFRDVPMLRELNCQDSHALSLVETESFHHIPHVAFLIFKKASETMCYFSPEDKETSSSMLLSKLYDKCQAQKTTHSASSLVQVRFYQLAYRPKGSKKNYTNSGEIYATARRYTLYNLLPGSTYQLDMDIL
ncbi:leucine-rich repeat neuronal protein 4 [Crotalus adamanteus]|uniref:Leucine-rich repeat neuronal protein 4 n=1 Tax=Crotalus adamanteus TaxID=8729 RepID=A0AAW1C9G8_CROAD